MALEFINVKGLTARIKAVREELAQLLHLETLVGGKPRRGRPAGSGATKVKTAKRGKKGKRGALGASIRAVLEKKGKAGAHVKDIAAEIGSKPANVTAFFYSPAAKKSKEFKNHGKAIWALNK